MSSRIGVFAATKADTLSQPSLKYTRDALRAVETKRRRDSATDFPDTSAMERANDVSVSDTKEFESFGEKRKR